MTTCLLHKDAKVTTGGDLETSDYIILEYAKGKNGSTGKDCNWLY